MIAALQQQLVCTTILLLQVSCSIRASSAEACETSTDCGGGQFCLAGTCACFDESTCNTIGNNDDFAYPEESGPDPFVIVLVVAAIFVALMVLCAVLGCKRNKGNLASASTFDSRGNHHHHTPHHQVAHDHAIQHAVMASQAVTTPTDSCVGGMGGGDCGVAIGSCGI